MLRMLLFVQNSHNRFAGRIDHAGMRSASCVSASGGHFGDGVFRIDRRDTRPHDVFGDDAIFRELLDIKGLMQLGVA